MLYSNVVRADGSSEYGEGAAPAAASDRLRSKELMPIALANAGRLTNSGPSESSGEDMLVDRIELRHLKMEPGRSVRDVVRNRRVGRAHHRPRRRRRSDGLGRVPGRSRPVLFCTKRRKRRGTSCATTWSRGCFIKS